MAITTGEIIDAIESTLSAASTVTRSQSYDELTESLTSADLPTLQVYPETGTGTSRPGTADRSTFGGRGGVENKPVREKQYTIHADYYATERKKIGQDMGRLVPGITAMENILEAQDVKPYFGLEGIKSFNWSWTRVSFTYGDPATPYVGARFVINVWVY